MSSRSFLNNKLFLNRQEGTDTKSGFQGNAIS